MENNIQNNIRWGQSWNLAVEMVASFEDACPEEPHSPNEDCERKSEFLKEKITQWQKWFYEELSKKPEEACQRCRGVEVYGGKGLKNGLCERCATESKFQERENAATIKKYKK